MDAAADVANEAIVVAPCDVLFGVPNENTGLSSTQCQPRYACASPAFEAPTYSQTDRENLRTWTLVTPFASIAEDPYIQAAPSTDGVCGAVLDPAQRSYRLQTFASNEALVAADARVTHAGACGVCSTFADLEVYMRHPDLTAPVRQCGLRHFSGTREAHVACLEELGFTRPCAEIWYYNTKHTAMRCSSECFAALGQPYHLADGSLNACLLCDERESGAIFKGIAGRTRRNTGLPNAMCRPCSEVQFIDHHYQ